MKYFFTFCLSLLLLKASSQTPFAQAFHGCGGATVTTYAGDQLWTNVTYEFQRQTGITWTTIHTSTSNWHIVYPGDVTVITTYRTLVRNNTTLDERISNGVTINPALFFNTVPTPNLQVIMNWGGDNTGGVNYAELVINAFNSVMRPPFTFEYKKTSEPVWQTRVSTTGIFVSPLDANAQYQFRVTDYCGQTSSTSVAELSSVATAVFNPAATNCAGGALQVGVSMTGNNTSQRFPFTFGVALLPSGTATNPVPQTILNSIAYSYPAGNISGLAHGQYVVRGKDRLGVLTKYVVRDISINPSSPFVASLGPYAGYCIRTAILGSNPHLKGIRLEGSTQPYVYTSGLTFNNLLGGLTYEMVLKDTCNRVSIPTLYTPYSDPPIINVVFKSIVNCKYVFTINAIVCSTPKYGLKLNGTSTIIWQNSNVFNNLPLIAACDSVFVKDSISGIIKAIEVCRDPLQANVFGSRSFADCTSPYEIDISPISGTPPYTFSISYDGFNFSNMVSTNTFTNLQPGTYNIRATDACGLSLPTSVPSLKLGSVFYLKQSGVNSNCNNGDTLGGFLQFGLKLFNNDEILSPPPYRFSIKEVTSINGNEVQYGNTVFSGQSNDTVITIKALDGNKQYGFFVTNGCGQSFTSANRESNVFIIPAFSSPAPDVNIEIPSCNAAFITVGNLPNGAQVRIFSGQDTAGAIQPMVNSSTSAVLAGGFYSVKINTANYNGCYWEKVYSKFINTDDSTRAGQYDQTVSSGLCAGISTTVSLYNHIINETPGGEWFSTPALNWANQFAGEFIPTDQVAGIYNITYKVTSYCGIIKQLYFPVSPDLGWCSLPTGDYESAITSSGCKTYAGDEWKNVFSSSGGLAYSIKAGNGNTIQSACWGVRTVPPFGNPPRTTVINGTTVYFADRNFYIEPSGTTIANPPVRIRLYYSTEEIFKLLNYLQTHGFPAATVNSLRILKKRAGPGSPVNLDVAYDAGASSSLYTVITPLAVSNVFLGSLTGYYFEFEINNFSEFALVFDNNVVLPVTWLYVNGKLQNNTAIIEWATASEKNSSLFEVEHSSNAVSFTKVGIVNAVGNSNSTTNYSFTHVSPVVGKNYYRIKQVDVDGNFTNSSIILLQYKDPKTNIIIAPNPVQNEATIFFKETGNKILQLLTTTAQIVYTEKIIGTNNSHTIDMSKLASGVYLLRLQTTNGIELHKIIKQ
jgi:hypothetical protein